MSYDIEVGSAARETRAAGLDSWLSGLFEAALPAGSATTGVALLATGGLGRRECAPSGDVDLLLIHRGEPAVTEIATRIWYPIWDARVGLDHSTRTPSEALSVAVDDPRVALSLLDARLVAGDADLAAEVRAAGLDQWRRTAGRALAALREARSTRLGVHGDLAYLLEGDVKEARGGLRDVQLIRAVGALGRADVFRPPVRAAHTRLLDVRDALHATAGRRVDRLLAQDRDLVAKRLDLRDGDALLRRVSTDARTIAYAIDDAWRAVDRWRHPGRSSRVPVARDVVAQDGELVLARAAIGPAADPTLAPRVAAASATSHLPVAHATLEWLVRFAPDLPRPWPDDARKAFVTLLGSGERLIEVWEAFDRHGLTGAWLPEWNRLRGLPQHHPIHVHTVDRHSVQAVAEARAYVRDVARPDLLLVSALLHDVGKGLPGDHSEVGAPVARDIALAMGFPPADADVVAKVVRLHLLLPNVATRRDVNDPVTVSRVAAAVGDVGALDLLHGLCRADALAAGPSATSPWKNRLIAALVVNVRALLDSGVLPGPERLDWVADQPLPVVEVTGTHVTVAAPDRRGLLADIAGVLATHRLDVIGADTWTDGDRAVVRVAAEPRFGQFPDRTRLAADLRAAANADLPSTPFARLAAPSRPARGAPPANPTVTWHTDVSSDAIVLELRCTDASGLLYRVTRALADEGANVRAARVATLGADVVDAFYLATPIGADARAALERVVLAAAG